MANANGNAHWRAHELGEARTLELDGGCLNVHVSGDGPAVVLVHGLLVNANLWRDVAPRLDACTRVAIDMPLVSHLIAMPARRLTPDDLGTFSPEDRPGQLADLIAEFARETARNPRVV